MAWHREGAPKTSNKKLTQLYCPSRKRSPKRLIAGPICTAKKRRGTIKKIIWRFALDMCPHFKIRSGATEYKKKIKLDFFSVYSLDQCFSTPDYGGGDH